MKRGVLGIFASPQAAGQALRTLQGMGIAITRVYTPVAEREFMTIAQPGRSPVRFVTFAGGTIGVVTGFALALYASGVWHLITDNKPVFSIVPFVVVGFEFLILFAALATLIALLGFGRLPQRAFPEAAWRPEFSGDRFGIWAAPPPERSEEVRSALLGAGALGVQDVEDGEGP